MAARKALVIPSRQGQGDESPTCPILFLLNGKHDSQDITNPDLVTPKPKGKRTIFFLLRANNDRQDITDPDLVTPKPRGKRMKC